MHLEAVAIHCRVQGPEGDGGVGVGGNRYVRRQRVWYFSHFGQK